MKRLLPLLAILVSLFLSSASEQPARAATNWKWMVGGAIHDAELLHFNPHTMTIAVGDTITWEMGEGAPHTITFGASAVQGQPLFVGLPFAPGRTTFNPTLAAPSMPSQVYMGDGLYSSGILNPGDSWTLSFGAPGTFSFICLLHPYMLSSVTVVPSGTSLPQTPDQVAAGIASMAASHFSSIAQATDPELTNTQATMQSDGTTQWRVTMAGMLRQPDINGNLAIVGQKDQFTPNRLSIHTGDTVMWQWTTSFHSVTFLGGEAPPDFLETVTPPPGVLPPGAPPVIPVLGRRAFEPSNAAAAAGSVTYDGMGFLNSGIRGAVVEGMEAGDFAPNVPAIIPQTLLSDGFSVTFTKPGTYGFLCLVHPGMNGVIQVEDRAAWPPLHVEVNAQHDGQRVTFYAMLRNLGSSAIGRSTLALRMPPGTTYVTSWAVAPTLNKGKLTGSDVGWGLTTSIPAGGSLGPFVLTVDVPEGTDPHTATSWGFATFANTQTSGTAVSPFRVTSDAPALP